MSRDHPGFSKFRVNRAVTAVPWPHPLPDRWHVSLAWTIRGIPILEKIKCAKGHMIKLKKIYNYHLLRAFYLQDLSSSKHFYMNLTYILPFNLHEMPWGEYTEEDKRRFTVVCVENNIIINEQYIKINWFCMLTTANQLFFCPCPYNYIFLHDDTEISRTRKPSQCSHNPWVVRCDVSRNMTLTPMGVFSDSEARHCLPL